MKETLKTKTFVYLYCSNDCKKFKVHEGDLKQLFSGHVDVFIINC